VPRPFTDIETAAIRDRLMAAGRASFGRRGLRGTTVEALARAAGISKGAFYGFFDSKESLFVALLEDHEAAQHAAIEAAVRRDPARGLEVLLDVSLRASEANPLIEVAMSDEGLVLLRGLPPDRQEALLRRDEVLVERVLGAMTEAGVVPQVSPRLLVGLLRSLVFLGWHREEIGPDLADDVAAWLTPTLRRALLADRRAGGEHGGAA
jgi:AcrR family transcriptional regulator